jgi:hypothetical protein
MNVTDQVIRSHQLYGASDSTNPAYYSSNKSLNYAKSANSLMNAQVERVTAIPAALKYADSVGLFGAENVFIKVQLDIENTISIYVDNGSPVNTYYPATIDIDNQDLDFYYEAGILDFTQDLFTLNEYEPAVLSNNIDTVAKPLVSIDLENLKTGNKYIDAWFDVRLYTKNRIEFPYDKMYVDPKDYFYIGFHARNTKRLPYNVSMVVGDIFTSEYNLPPSERRYLASNNLNH